MLRTISRPHAQSTQEEKLSTAGVVLLAFAVAAHGLTQQSGRFTFNHMVESSVALDLIFQSLADCTRRDILRRLSRAEQTIGALAEPYSVSLAAIAKHVNVLERAGLVTKKRCGKEKIVSIVPAALRTAEAHLSEYETLWAARYNALETLLTTEASEREAWQHSRSRRPKARKT